jgi:hypothetical protein
MEMKKSFLLVVVSGIAGMAMGYAIGYLVMTHPQGQFSTGSQMEQAASGAASQVDAEALTKLKKPGIMLKVQQSTDTLDSILALGFSNANYARLASWMLDASEQDIATYWQKYRQQGGDDNDIFDLIFINWTRINPQAAVAAAKGTPYEGSAWWCWALYDPQMALDAVKLTSPDFAKYVAGGIGEYHPDWLMKHFDQIPESARQFAMLGFNDHHADPREVLNFLKANNQPVIFPVFVNLVRQDPLAAMNWLRKNGEGYAVSASDDFSLSSVFFRTMSEDHPELLGKIADQLPSGAMKWKLQQAEFEKLLQTDPTAAIEMAQATKSKQIAVQRLASAGLSLVSGDTTRAFDLAQKILALSPDSLVSYRTEIVGPNNYPTRENADDSAKRFVGSLIARDPERMMALVMPDGPSANTTVFSDAASEWVKKDVNAFASWAEDQSDATVHDISAGLIATKMINDGNYSVAAEWLMSKSNASDDNGSLYTLMNEWERSDKAAAKAWLANAKLPEEKKARLNLILERK